MEREDYKIKYLKYKQKYTNALQNMQGGGETELMAALITQPKVVFAVNKNIYDILKIVLGIASSVGTKVLPDRYTEKSIQLAISMHNPTAIRILPMKNFYVRQTESKYFRTSAQNQVMYKDGVQKVDNSPAPGGNLFLNNPFGTDAESSNLYNSATALAQLQDSNTKNYFNKTCGLEKSYYLIFNGNTLHFCGEVGIQ